MRAAWLLVSLVLAGCGSASKLPQVSEADIRREEALERRMALALELDRRQRLFDVVYRLARAAAPDCAGGRPLAGFELGGAGLVTPDYAAAAEASGLGEAVTVLAVAESSPAHAAGVRRGDVVETLAGRAVRPGRHAYREAGFALAERLTDGPVELSLRRGDRTFAVTLQAERGCATDIFITREALPTPKANGKAVLMPVSFMRQARRDDELAAIAAFLMAYNIRGQADSGQGAMLTSARDLTALVGEDETNLYQPPQPLDYVGVREADEYAIRLARRAGYDPARVVQHWRHYLISTPALEADTLWGRGLLGAERLARLQAWAESPGP